MARKQGISAAETAEKIKQRATHLFAQHGYEAVTMRQIAAAVGVMPGALYHHFVTKQELLACLMNEHMQRLLTAWKNYSEDIHFHALRADVQLDKFVVFHIHYHITLPDDVFLSFMELRSLDTENFQKIEQQRKAYEFILKTILTDGQRSGDMSVHDVHVTAMAILGMLTGLNGWFNQSGRLSEQEITGCYRNLAAQMVGLKTETPHLLVQTDFTHTEEQHV